MRASSSSPAAAHAPQPLPLPLPPPPLSLPSPPAAPRRGRHRNSSASSSSSSSSSAVSTASSFSFFPSPSPAASPPRGSAASLVPFSWERHPGVPKTSSRGGLGGSPTGDAPLPLPPPLLRPAPRHRRRRRSNVSVYSSEPGTNNSDPFVAAFAECTREEDDFDSADHGADDADVAVAKNKLWMARTKPAASSGRRWRIPGGGGGGLVGFLDLYGCKSAMAVADGVFVARRPPVVAHGRRATRR